MGYINGNEILFSANVNTKHNATEMYDIAWEQSIEFLTGYSGDNVVVVPCLTLNCDRVCKNNTNVVIAVIPFTSQNTGNNGFYGCSNLQAVYIGEGVSRVDAWCFTYCTSLYSVKLPSTVKGANSWIGDYAFWGSGLTVLDMSAIDVENADELPALHSTKAFPSGFKTIYVKSEEIKEMLISKTNWAAMADKIFVKG